MTSIAFGLVPAVRMAKPRLQESLKTGRYSATDPGQALARRALVMVELAVALVLLVGASLMLQSVTRLLGVDPGFDPERVLTLETSFVGNAYREDEQVLASLDAVLERVRALPGVQAVAAAGQIPLGGNMDMWAFHIEGRIAPNPSEDPFVERYSVTTDYFRAVGIPLRRGRTFDDGDGPMSTPVMIVGETTARRLWPGEDPIGQRVRVGDAATGPWRTVVGIVGDVRHYEWASLPTMQMYVPQRQITDSYLTLLVRTARQPEGLAPLVRQEIRAVAKDVPIHDVAPMLRLVDRSLAQRRFVRSLFALFAALAVTLAGIGTYGLISYAVAQRTPELAVRLALGAEPHHITALLLAGGLGTIATGLAAGLAGAIGLTRFLETLLYEVSATDPVTLASVLLLLAFVAIAAHVVPLRRALRVDPAAALREQ